MIPAPTEMNWRSLFGAVHAQDMIRVNPKLTLSLGFRGRIFNRMERGPWTRCQLHL